MSPPRPGLARARERAGLSQRELAERAGLRTRVRISQYENGHVAPSVDVALTFAAILDTTVEDLFTTATAGPEAGRDGREETKPLPGPQSTRC